MIRVVKMNGIATINGRTCTFETKQIREEIETMLEVNDSFNLPTRYSFEVVPSEHWGKVAKIKSN